MFLVQGPSSSTIGVLFTPLIHEFHFTRAQVSTIPSCYILATGVISPIAGWLAERLQARWVMLAGVLAAAGGYLLASQAHSLHMLQIAYLLVGVGVSAGAFVPATLVVVSWFGDRRGLALGMMQLGTAAGLTLGPLGVGLLLLHHTWRFATQWLAWPVLFVAAPVIIAMVRPQPRVAVDGTPHAPAPLPPGLELKAALHSVQFWLLALVQICFGVAIGSVTVHIVSHLIQMGFAPATAAAFFGLQAAFAAVGYPTQGTLSDRYGGRTTMILVCAVSAISIVALKNVSPAGFGLVAMGVFAFCYATTAGSSSTVIPMMAVEALGRRSFGSVVGVLHLLYAIATAAGQMLSGVLYDYAGSYRYAFDVTLLVLGLCVAFSLPLFPAQGHDMVAEGVEPEPVAGIGA
jgi:MFS family permease